jgi:dTDP-4-amino-4,6-dideoxygalactose transaminase
MPGKQALEKIDYVFRSGFINEGEEVSLLTNQLETYLKVNNLLLTNSCTSALTLALKVCGVNPGDEVLTVSMTCIATNTPIVNLGAKIVWVDIDPITGSINTEEIRKKISKKTKAILFVAWAGNPCQLDQIEKVSSEFGLPTIQDAAHAFGAEWRNESIANWADFTCFSFQAIKHFTTGDGGGLVCRDSKNFSLAKKLKWFGYDRDAVKDSKGEWKGQRWDADILENEIGYKFNMNNISAAIGLAQLPFIDNILKRHRDNAEVFSEILGASPLFELLKLDDKAKSSNWVFTIRIKASTQKRDKVLAELISRGIGAGLVHLPNHNYSAFREFWSELPGTKEFAESQISLPCGWWLEREECEFIANQLIDVTQIV